MNSATVPTVDPSFQVLGQARVDINTELERSDHDDLSSQFVSGNIIIFGNYARWQYESPRSTTPDNM